MKPKKDTDVFVPRSFIRPPRPTVMMFQPTTFEILPNERLKDWEEMLVNRVGLKRADAAERAKAHQHYGMITESGCPGETGRLVGDDCDEL